MDGAETPAIRGRGLLAAAAAGAAEAPALQAPDLPDCSHAALRAALEGAARMLAPFGPTTRVMTLLPDHGTTAAALLALCDVACCAPANPAWTEAELERHARALGADAVLSRPGDARADRLARDLGLGRIALHPGTAHAADFALEVVAPPAPGGAEAEERAAEAPALILPTSGSTGAPKLVPLTAGALRLSAANIARTLRLGPGDAAVHMLPMFHVGAVVDLMLAPLSAGGAVRLAHPASTEALLAALRRPGATWLQAAPAMLHGLLAGASADELRALGGSLRFVRAVSADLAPAVQAELEARLGGVPVIQMYGMTETAGQIASNPLPPEARRPGAVGRPDGAEAAVLDPAGRPVAPGAEGEVCVRGPTVTRGYENAPRAEHFHGEFLRTGDLGRLEADGFLVLTGRASEVVNRGGEKIAPREVERALLAHPGVADAAAFGVSHASLGEEMAAAVVPRPGREAEADAEALRAHLARSLAPYKIPRRLLLLEALPRLGGGKIDKRALRALAEAGPEPADGAEASPSSAPRTEAPRTEAGRVAARLWARRLRTDPPGPETDFFDAGGDSLAVQSFVLELERALGVDLPANLLFEAPRFAEFEQALQRLVEAGPQGAAGAGAADALPDLLHRRVKAATAGWRGRRRHARSLLVGRREAGTKAPFFFCGLDPRAFESLAEALDPERPFYAMRPLSGLRRRGRKLKSEANTRALARAYAAEIAEIRPEGPILIGGVCQGVLAAREAAAALREAGREVALLVQIDRVIAEAWPTPAAVIWSKDSEHSPASWFLRPRAGLGALFPAGAAALALNARHMPVVRGKRGARIAAFLEPRLEAAAAGPVPAADAAVARQAARRARRRARLTLSCPRFARPGGRLRVIVEAENIGEAPWAPTRRGGPRLLLKWRDLRGRPRDAIAGGASLEARLPPGGRMRWEVEVEVPRFAALHRLEADMVDDGEAWFHWSGGRPARRAFLRRP